MSIEHESDQQSSVLIVPGNQPLIGVPSAGLGQDVTYYFTTEQDQDAVVSTELNRTALQAVGGWQDLDWDEVESALERIRQTSQPTPPIEL
jgi:hypothetical protein